MSREDTDRRFVNRLGHGAKGHAALSKLLPHESEVQREARKAAGRPYNDIPDAPAVLAEVVQHFLELRTVIAFANEMLARFEGSHERFILNDTIATQLRRLRRYEEAELGYEATFADFDAATHTEQVYTLHNAASVVGLHDPVRAAELLARAGDIVRNSGEEFDAARLAIVSADLGLAYWYSGRLAEAFNEWDSVASMLVDGESVEENARHGLVGFLTILLQQISNSLQRGELGENERAVIGTFDRDVTALAEHWKPSQIGLLAAALTLIAAQVGRDDRAFVWIDRAVAVARELNDPTVTAFSALQALPWALARNDFAGALRFALDLRGNQERQPTAGDSEFAQSVFLITFQLCALMLTDPQRARDGMSSVSIALREVVDEPDAPMLAEVLAAASRTDSHDEMNECCARTPPGSAAWATAQVLRASTSRRSTIERATDHVTIAPHVVARASLWAGVYSRVVLPFFEAFWQHEVSANAFCFRAPASLRRELEQSRMLPLRQRLQGLLKCVSDALDLNLSREFRDWFQAAQR